MEGKEQEQLSQEEQQKVFDDMAAIFGNDISTEEEFVSEETTQKIETEQKPDVKTNDVSKETTDKVETENKPKSTLVDLAELPDNIKDYYLASKEEGFDEQKYYQERQKENELLSLNDKDFMIRYYKSNFGKTEQKPDGLTDEEIIDDISKMPRLQLKTEAEKFKGQLAEYLNTKKQERLNKISTNKYDSKEYLERIENTIKKNKDVKDAFGIELSDAEKVHADEAFRQYNKPNPETGKTPLQEMLEDDDMRYYVTALINTGKSGIKGKLSDMKEKIKSDIIKKLGIEPEDQGGIAIGQSQDFDPNVFI